MTAISELDSAIDDIPVRHIENRTLVMARREVSTLQRRAELKYLKVWEDSRSPSAYRTLPARSVSMV